MSTYQATWNTCRPAPRFPWLILVVAFAAAVGMVVLGTHAAKHSMADVVRNCPQDKIGLILLNPLTGRRVIVCEYEKDQWGRQIIEGSDEVTSYADSTNPLNNLLSRVIQSLYKGGYNHVQYIKPELFDRVVEILAVVR